MASDGLQLMFGRRATGAGAGCANAAELRRPLPTIAASSVGSDPDLQLETRRHRHAADGAGVPDEPLYIEDTS